MTEGIEVKLNQAEERISKLKMFYQKTLRIRCFSATLQGDLVSTCKTIILDTYLSKVTD